MMNIHMYCVWSGGGWKANLLAQQCQPAGNIICNRAYCTLPSLHHRQQSAFHLCCSGQWNSVKMPKCSWAAWSNSWLFSKLMPKGVSFCLYFVVLLKCCFFTLLCAWRASLLLASCCEKRKGKKDKKRLCLLASIEWEAIYDTRLPNSWCDHVVDTLLLCEQCSCISTLTCYW